MSIVVKGKTYAITGTLKSMSRSEAAKKLTALGAIITKSVSSKTDYLVAGSGAGSKLEKARIRGVTVLNEEQFLALLKGKKGKAVEALATAPKKKTVVPINEALRDFRELGYDDPNQKTWNKICELLDKCPPEALDMAVDYIEPKVGLWPGELSLDDLYWHGYYRYHRGKSDVRAAPESWAQKMLRGEDSAMWRLPRIFSYSGMGVTGKVAGNLAACDQLKNLDALIMGRNKLPGTFAKVLASSPQFQNIQILALGQNNIGKTGAKYLTAGLPKLRELSLDKNKLGGQGAAALSQGVWPELRRLKLEENDITDDAAVSLARGRWPELTHLNLRSNRIGTIGATALAEAGWTKLQHLNLTLNPIGAAGLAALSNSPALANLETFFAAYNSFNINDPEPLFQQPMPKLKHLNIESESLGDDGAEALAAAVDMPALEKLEIYSSNITERGARALFGSRALSGTKELILNYNRNLGDGIQALVEAKHWKSLQQLHLRDCNITPAMARALLLSKHLKSLKALYLDSNPLDESVAEALLEATHLKKLENIDLSAAKIGEDLAWKLIQATHLKKLKGLNLGHRGRFSEELQAALHKHTGHRRHW